jgi:hypothetical protein
MRFARNLSVFVKIALILMVALSVFVSGCNNDKGWKNARYEAVSALDTFDAGFDKMLHGRLKKMDANVDKDIFYKLRAMVPSVEEKIKIAEDVAKGDPDRAHEILIIKRRFDTHKRNLLRKAQENPLIPKTDLNFNVKANN